ncbi:MAG TPA: thioredoxin domain-containing protein [Longimicrobiales bacterium]|nr:thioredoxin domain-containing protein [Longimicrobiales bacterium]
MPQDPTPNLAGSRSPFLRHGATQPVNWLPWSDAAFERAGRENRPILLDIGAVWCHWCHVMDRESYESAETARLINELFVPVKVDRDERPDVDARYQRAVQSISGQGGWPLTAFLTPDGEVFYGGTYFPPEDGYGRPSFRRVLTEVARIWDQQREQALEMARQVRERLSVYEQAEGQPGQPSPHLVTEAVEEFAHLFDFRHGGFGRAPKFPNAGATLLLLDRHLDTGEEWSLRIVRDTLRGMARGGIQDHLGGGFHRYTTDARWLIPHFEKMAYDNGVLLEAYARAAAVIGDPLIRAAAAGILDYYRDVAPELLAQGGFPASQDADVAPDDDGGYWTWTADEVREALGDERTARAAILRYGVDDRASAMHHDPARHVLYLAREVGDVAREINAGEAETHELLENACRRLKAARDRRPRPFVDETLYTGWVSLVASGHIAAARYLGRADAGQAAQRALQRLWDEAFDIEDGLAHRVGDGSVGAYLEDQALAAQALLDLFELTQDHDWLERAQRVADVMIARFRDDEGGFQDRPRGEAAPARPLTDPHRPVTDSPYPSGNGVAALVLLRLGAHLVDSRYLEAGVRVLAVFAGSIPQMATSCATYLRALDWATSPVTSVVVVASRGDERGDTLVRTALATYRPRTIVRRFEPGRVEEEEVLPEIAAMLTGEAPRAYVCAGHACAAPVDRPEALADLLRTFRG